MSKDASQLGAAMVAAARSNAASFLQRRDGSVEFNAWWRGGEHLKVRVWPDRATWKDIKSSVGGGARDFAQAALGCSLAEMLERYGSGEVQPAARAPVAVERRSLWAPGEAQACWFAHLKTTTPTQMDGVCRWLLKTRGISMPPASGMVPTQVERIPAVPLQGEKHPTVQAWAAEQEQRGGRSVLLPLWSTAGTVEGLVMRFARPALGAKKSLNLKGLTRRPGHPVAFGYPHRLKRAVAAVVVEGAPDLWALEALFAEHLVPVGFGEGRAGISVLGVDGNGGLRDMVKPLAAAGLREVVFIPQLDKVGVESMHATATELAKLGTAARLMGWEPLLRAAIGCGVADKPDGLKDLADLTRAAHQMGVGFDAVRNALFGAIAESGNAHAA